jgi:hypothetical protein
LDPGLAAGRPGKEKSTRSVAAATALLLSIKRTAAVKIATAGMRPFLTIETPVVC